jgi:hypothetical protein
VDGDSPEFEIRYSYRTRPDVPEPITQSRAFCEKLIQLNRTYSRQDIDTISTRVDRDVWKYKGGWYTNPDTGKTTPYCRHEWVQQIAIKKPAVGIVAPEQPLIEEPLIEVGEIKINTIKEGREFAKKVIEEALGVKVSKLSIARDMTPARIQKYMESVVKIKNEYNLDQEISDEIKLTLNSTGGNYGFVQPGRRSMAKGGGIEIIEINLGNRTNSFIARDPKLRVVEKNGRLINAPKSSVDEKNLELATAVHEMGHVMAWNYSKTPNVQNYFSKLKEIRTEYFKEINDLLKDKKINELNKVYLGEYANKNIDEFHAECWTEYRLNSNPSKYAKIVGELIDKNFKK